MNDCRCLLHRLQNYKYSHVFREANTMSNLLAKNGNECFKALSIIVTLSYVLAAFNNDVTDNDCHRSVVSDYFVFSQGLCFS